MISFLLHTSQHYMYDNTGYSIVGEFGIGLYNNGMETLPGPEIKVKACHSPNNNFKHKRTADNHVNPDIDST